MKLHQVRCDLCGIVKALKWNGEHWLLPSGWLSLYDDEKEDAINQHICNKCKPKNKPEKEYDEF